MRTQLKLKPDVIEAVREYNLRTTGREVTSQGIVTDHEVLERLERLAFPNEDLNDTILRILNQGGALPN